MDPATPWTRTFEARSWMARWRARWAAMRAGSARAAPLLHHHHLPRPAHRAAREPQVVGAARGAHAALVAPVPGEVATARRQVAVVDRAHPLAVRPEHPHAHAPPARPGDGEAQRPRGGVGHGRTQLEVAH